MQFYLHLYLIYDSQNSQQQSRFASPFFFIFHRDRDSQTKRVLNEFLKKLSHLIAIIFSLPRLPFIVVAGDSWIIFFALFCMSRSCCATQTIPHSFTIIKSFFQLIIQFFPLFFFPLFRIYNLTTDEQTMSRESTPWWR